MTLIQLTATEWKSPIWEALTKRNWTRLFTNRMDFHLLSIGNLAFNNLTSSASGKCAKKSYLWCKKWIYRINTRINLVKKHMLQLEWGQILMFKINWQCRSLGRYINKMKILPTWAKQIYKIKIINIRIVLNRTSLWGIIRAFLDIKELDQLTKNKGQKLF